MKAFKTYGFLLIAMFLLASCSTTQLARNTGNDDVYHTISKAKEVEYVPQRSYSDNSYSDDDYYYGTSNPYYDMNYSSRIQRFYGNFYFRNYYDPFFDYHYGSAFSPYYGYYANPFSFRHRWYLGYNMYNPWYSYGYSPYYSYWGPYSRYDYYGMGGYGGYYGGGYYGGGYPIYGGRVNNNPRPNRIGDNPSVRPSRTGNNGIYNPNTGRIGNNNNPNRVGTRPDRMNGGVNMGRPATSTTPSNQRPMRGDQGSRPQNNNGQMQRPPASARPERGSTYNPPQNSNPTRSSGSSSSGGSTGGRPTRGGN